MNIKLISPRMSLRPMDSEYKRAMAPSLGLLVLAALTPSKHHVHIQDENVEELDLDDSPDLVGITTNVDTSKRAYDIAACYRDKNVPVILGGIHASADPHEALGHCDSVCIGEAEELWEQILRDCSARSLKESYYNTEATDISRTPLPKWELLNRSKYLYTSIICASRGCPFKCEFCYNSCDYVNNKYRNRPVENVVEEISKLGTRQVMFVDDNFIGNTKWTKKLIEAIKPLSLTWHAAVSANIVSHEDLLDKMADSGCQSLFIGFESINERSIRNMNKHQNHIDKYEELIQQIHTRGMMVNASMVFGFDCDYPSVFEETLEWLVENKIETVTAHILTPYPGTVFYKRLQQENRIIDYDWSHYNTSNVVYKPKNMTVKELYDGYLWLYKKFYSFGNILRRIPSHSKQKLPYLLFNIAYRKFGKITSTVAQLGFMNSVGKLARRLSYGID
ncbi:MAG: B12-binding domain-containing radical SAM protein [Planctomycetota bacterium]|jgi:radical SAM superfamily enzyme YgiQ (UPF0313 family)